jgi:4-hydroxybenzoate polyprenyltransferase
MPGVPVARVATGLLRLVRIENCFAVALTTGLGAYLAVGPATFGSSAVARAVAVTVLLIAAGNVVNDRVDLAVDADARPGRPLPAGVLSVSTADRLYVSLSAAGLVLALTLGAAAAAVAALVVALSLAYSLRLKRTVLLGNTVVAGLTAATVVYGAWTVGDVGPRHVLAALSVGLMMLSFEVLKCAQDHRTDGLHRIPTVSTVYGREVALRLGCLLLVPLPVLLLAPPLFLAVAWPQTPLAVGVLLLVVAGVSQVRRAVDEATITRCLARIKISWFLGVLALAALRP